MWKSVVGHDVSMKVAAEGDDWETDPDFENDVSEQEQRWGAKTIEGSGRKEHIREVWSGEGQNGQGQLVR
uniref:Hematopoietic cell-specific Lyn substrate 1 n=1 Tax=Labrus bergylta TaxID=56723 RepID=A0A3Q3FDL4_9LABR